MESKDYITIIALIGAVAFAGCSGVLSGGDTTSPTPVEQPTSTTVQTPEVTPTPTPSGSEDHRRFAEALGKGLERFNPSNETWVRETAAHENGTISIHVEKPDRWSFKRAEMEVVREAVRGMKLGTLPSKSAAKNSDEKVHRPKKVHIHVETAKGNPGTSITLDSELATRYRQEQVSIEAFASKLSETRNSDTEENIGENETSYYLKIAEWRQLQDEQLYIISQYQFEQPPTTIEVDKAVVSPADDELQYRYSPPDEAASVIREGIFTRSYWEAIRNVSNDQLVNRYPERLRVYADVQGGEDVETTVRTEYAFDFLEVTGGDISDENILTSGAWDVYYNKVNTTFYEDR